MKHCSSKDDDDRDESYSPPTVFLLHPSQPLSHVSRLLVSALTPTILSIPKTQSSIDITFQSTTPKGSKYQWSDSTDLGDFIRDAAKAAEFQIRVRVQPSQTYDASNTESTTPLEKSTRESQHTLIIPVEVPTFKSRTRYLRLRIHIVDKQLEGMEELKKQCDREAHKGARRMAVGGFGMLVVYWGAVARLTFWDYGWYVHHGFQHFSSLCGFIDK